MTFAPLPLSAPARVVSGMRLASVRAPQAFAVVDAERVGYAAQLSATPGSDGRGDLVITRFSLDTWRELDHMWLLGYGHGVSIGAEPGGWLWVECNPKGSSARGQDIARVRYRPGVKVKGSAGQLVLKVGASCTPSVDLAAGQLAIRARGYVRVHDLAAARDGQLVAQGEPVKVPDMRGRTFQGWCWWGQHVYAIAGATGQAPLLARAAAGAAPVYQTGAKPPSGHWEPEGIAVIRGQLHYGGSVGAGRRYLALYRTSTPITTPITTTTTLQEGPMITAPAGGQAAKLIAIARAEVGYREQYAGGHYNNHQKYSNETPGFTWSDYQAWCDTFVAWAFYKAGLSAILKPAGGSASCLSSTRAWKAADRFSEYPAVGAQILFGSNGGTHTGIVYGYDATYVYTIEGNTNTTGSAEGDGVYLKRWRRDSSYVYGYGYPSFAEGIVSADPAWADKAPKTTTPPPVVPTLPVVDLSDFTAAHKIIEAVDEALAAKGYRTGTLEDRMRAFQEAQHWEGTEADGRIGAHTASLLGFTTTN